MPVAENSSKTEGESTNVHIQEYRRVMECCWVEVQYEAFIILV
jgi:hypothetical protein